MRHVDPAAAEKHAKAHDAAEQGERAGCGAGGIEIVAEGADHAAPAERIAGAGKVGEREAVECQQRERKIEHGVERDLRSGRERRCEIVAGGLVDNGRDEDGGQEPEPDREAAGEQQYEVERQKRIHERVVGEAHGGPSFWVSGHRSAKVWGPQLGAAIGRSGPDERPARHCFCVDVALSQGRVSARRSGEPAAGATGSGAVPAGGTYSASLHEQPWTYSLR